MRDASAIGVVGVLAVFLLLLLIALASEGYRLVAQLVASFGG